MYSMKKKAKRIIAAGALIILLLPAMIVLSSYGSRNFEITRNLDIFTTLFRELVVNYVEDVNASEMMKSGIDGMLNTLDPYTTFIPESEIEDVRFMTTGQYGGIGAAIQRRGEYVMIAEPHPGFPAQKAGLLPGDIILEINGQSVKGRHEDQVRNLLMGQPGTTLTLLIERYGEDSPLMKSLTREVVKIDNIPYSGMLNEHTAYIRLTGFTQHAGREVREAFKQLSSEYQVQNLILDLRGNGGGLMHEAVNIANLFLDKGQLIVNTRGRIEDRSTTHRTLNEPMDTEIPLVILIDPGTASASEIVAGAIQDYDRGVIVGQRSFGKGLVQNVVPLSYNTQLKVTVAQYYIPSGRSLQAINYAQRREDGSVAMIPDSLKVAHTTRGGRTVYDGGGIDPDIVVDISDFGMVTRALIRDYMIFDFATRYSRQHEQIPSPDEFRLTDQIYEDFVHFVAERDFNYITESERLLNELRRVSRSESYYEAIKPEFDQLAENFRKEKEQDLYTFRNEIERFLREEIVARYHSQRGRIISSLSDDPDIRHALQVLSDEQMYRSILALKE